MKRLFCKSLEEKGKADDVNIDHLRRFALSLLNCIIRQELNKNNTEDDLAFITFPCSPSPRKPLCTDLKFSSHTKCSGKHNTKLHSTIHSSTQAKTEQKGKKAQWYINQQKKHGNTSLCEKPETNLNLFFLVTNKNICNVLQSSLLTAKPSRAPEILYKITLYTDHQLMSLSGIKWSLNWDYEPCHLGRRALGRHSGAQTWALMYQGQIVAISSRLYKQSSSVNKPPIYIWFPSYTRIDCSTSTMADYSKWWFWLYKCLESKHHGSKAFLLLF